MTSFALTFSYLVAAMLQGTSGVEESQVLRDMRVTLLDARRLTLEEYREARGNESGSWAGGGFRFAFLVENRPGAPMPAALGDVRVLIGSERYNVVTNASSQKPFAPLVVIRADSDFFSSSYGATLRVRAPQPRRMTTAVVLEVFIPGSPVPSGTSGTVELEQGETHRPDGTGGLQPLRPDEIAKTWTWFRFAFPRLD
jgi:hypothetical protein